MARVNEHQHFRNRWIKMDWNGWFNSDDHYIYYCRQESLRRNGVAIIINQKVQNTVLGCNLKNDRMISVRFQGKPNDSVSHPNPKACSNSCPLSWQWHPTISSSVIPFSHLPSFPASGSFQMSQLFTSGGQSIGVSASESVLLMNIEDLFPLGWTGWVSLQSKGLSRVFFTQK